MKYRRCLLLTIAFALSALMFWLRDNSVATAATENAAVATLLSRNQNISALSANAIVSNK